MMMDELDIFENDSEQVKQLKRRIISLESQLLVQRHRNENMKGGNLLATEDIDYYQGEQLDFINERYITKRVTSFTSNLGINELRNVGYDDRILSRIEEMCYVVPFPSTVSVRNLLGTKNTIDWKGMS